MYTSVQLTFRRTEEVEERVIGNSFCNRPDCSTALMFLLLLNGFQSNILSFFPVYLATKEQKKTPNYREKTHNHLQLNTIPLLRVSTETITTARDTGKEERILSKYLFSPIFSLVYQLRTRVTRLILGLFPSRNFSFSTQSLKR